MKKKNLTSKKFKIFILFQLKKKEIKTRKTDESISA